jgi:hypothetical protein
VIENLAALLKNVFLKNLGVLLLFSASWIVVIAGGWILTRLMRYALLIAPFVLKVWRKRSRVGSKRIMKAIENQEMIDYKTLNEAQRQLERTFIEAERQLEKVRAKPNVLLAALLSTDQIDMSIDYLRGNVLGSLEEEMAVIASRSRDERTKRSAIVSLAGIRSGWKRIVESALLSAIGHSEFTTAQMIVYQLGTIAKRPDTLRELEQLSKGWRGAPRNMAVAAMQKIRTRVEWQKDEDEEEAVVRR